jgi:hypothetical protein
MREAHPVFDNAMPPDTPIWRYFDFPKFVSLLQERALYFSRANLLGDPLEGSFPRSREAERQALLARPPEGRTREELEKIFKHNASWYEAMPYAAYVNCWHVGEHESMALWRGYGAGPYGVAVRSTIGLLEKLLPQKFAAEHLNNIFVGRVRYVDYTSETERLVEENNFYSPFVCKSLPYRHESEVRAIFIDIKWWGRQDSPLGHFIRVDLSQLLQRVTISPLAPGWFQDVVQKVCTAASLEVEVTKSIVYSRPIY